VGVSEGVPDQSFPLRHQPVQPDSLALRLEVQGQPETWEPVLDFFASQADDPHYILDATAGTLQFGNGVRGRIPVAGANIIATQYRYGGGTAGNVGSGLISVPQTPLVGVDKVTNERAAVGGLDEQQLEDLKEQAPSMLRSRNRAVTADDFTALARQAGGVANARALALAHPDHPGVQVPGAITVVILPVSQAMPPEPAADLIESVCRYLNQFRLITTEVYVAPPTFLAIKVVAQVAAYPYTAFDNVTQKVEAALNDYLNPLQWNFGQDFHPTSLYSVILSLKDLVVSVPYLTVWVNDRPLDNLADQVVVPPDGLVYGVGHDITVVPATDL
jgi:predicted phage baseplate assembly protein